MRTISFYGALACCPQWLRSIGLGLALLTLAGVRVLAQTTIPQTNWTLHYVDSQETAGWDNAARHAFDGDPNTVWATQWLGTQPPPPHEIQINLGATYSLTGFRYLPRQDAPEGRVAQYEFYVSADGGSWGAPVATGTFPDTTAEQQVLFSAKTGRYVRLRVLTEVGGLPVVAVAELNVVGGGSAPGTPALTDVAPASGPRSTTNLQLTLTGDLTHFMVGGVFDNGSVAGFTNGSAVTFSGTGVTAGQPTVTDATHLTVPVTIAAGATLGPRTVTVTSGPEVVSLAGGFTVTGQSNAPPIPRSAWTLRYVDSVEGTWGGALAFDGDPNTIWSTKFTNGGPPPPHEIQIDLAAAYDVIGFRYLPNQGFKAGRVGEYEFYVSADGTTWGAPVAIGAFPDDNSAGEREVLFAPKPGQYVRFRALSDVTDTYDFSTVAELNVLRANTAPNQAPSATMLSPAQALTIPAGSAVTLSGAGSDPDGNLPLTYRWSVGPGSGVVDATTLTPGIVHFDRPGAYVLSFTVGDAFGKTAVATRSVRVLGGVPISQAIPWTGSADSQEISGGPFFLATNAFDGNPSTFWSTQFIGTQPPPPHDLQINLGSTHSINGFRYLPRQDGSSVGRVSQYAFYVSADGVNWGAPVATGTLANVATEQEVYFVTTPGHYVRFRALAEVSGGPSTTMAELRVLETQCATSSVQLLQPKSLDLQTSSTLHVVADACVSPGQGVRLVVDGNVQTDDYAPPYAGDAINLAHGEHMVEAFVINAAGAPVSGSATYDRAIPVGVGDFYVAIGDGMTVGYGDNKTDDDSSQDGRNTTGGYTPILANLLTAAKGYPVTVINAGLGGTASAHGLASLPTLLARYPQVQRVLILYGHNDYLINNAPSGLGLSPGQPGYAGSFKDNMQRMIDMLKAVGKTAVLAKAPGALPFGGPTDVHIQEYNQAIDELYNNPANAIPAPPPDFRAYFLNYPEEYASDDVDLTGIGYMHLAQLWRDALMPFVRVRIDNTRLPVRQTIGR